jgi:WD40 repeat protein
VRFRNGTNVTAVSFSADASQLVTGDMDVTLCLWDVATGMKLRQLGRGEGGGFTAAFSPDGKLVAAAGFDTTREDQGVVFLWDATSWKQWRHELKAAPGESFYSLAFSADSTAVAAGTTRGRVLVWDTTTGKESTRLEGHQGTVRSVAFSPDGKTLASGGDDKTARLWDLATGKELHLLEGHADLVVGLAFAPDGKTVATGTFVPAGEFGPDGYEPLRIWDVATGKEVRQIKGGPGHGFERLALSADGKTLIAGGVSTPRAYDWATGRELRRYGDDARGNAGGFVALSADGKTLASARGAAIRLWATDTAKEVLPPGSGGHLAEVLSLAFAPDGRTLASGGSDGAVCLWDAAAGKELRRLPLAEWQRPSPVAFFADGRLLAAGTADGKVRFWDSATGKESPPALEGKKRLRFVAPSADGKSLIARDSDGMVGVWDVAARKEVRAVQGAPGFMTAMAVSPDGKLLAFGGDDGTIRTWDFAAGKELRSWPAHGNEGGANWVGALAFCPDGTTLASGGGDATVRLWDVATGNQLMRSEREKDAGHRTAVNALAFSPNGCMLASGSSDHTVRLWEVATRQERHCFEGHAGEVRAVAFAGDGRTLASAGADTTVLLWDATGRPTAPAPAPPRLDAEQLKTIWAGLASKDAKAGFAAVGTLVRFPAQAVPLLEGRLRAVPAADAKRVAQLLADLDSDAFETRDRAARELQELGDTAEPPLRRALAGKPSAEVRRAIGTLLSGLEGGEERRRARRALEVLEYVGTAEARQLLRGLAKGAPEAWLTREAQAAAERLDQRPRP